jgi:GNAT superfamily N-acetyltransferase
MSAAVSVRPIEEADRGWLAADLADWGMRSPVSRGRLTEDASVPPGFLAERGGTRVYVLVRQDGDELEVVAIRSLEQRAGIGTPLLLAAEAEARRLGCVRAWLVTTNDDLDAIRFYQRRGWELAALHRDALDESRRLKPEISEVGEYGIPMRHELEFELLIT